MGISRKSTAPSGVTNTSGQPEIVLEIEGLTLSMAPPARDPDDDQNHDQDDPAEDDVDGG